MVNKNCSMCEEKYDGHVNSKYCKECKKKSILLTKKKYRDKIKEQKKQKFENETKGEWIDVKDYEGLYMINKKGEVKSSVRKGGGNILLKPYLGNNGYYSYKLRKKNEGCKTFSIHRLLGLHFIDNPNNLPVIDHIDRNRTNNELSNLRWASYKLNACNKTKKGSVYIDKRTIKGVTYKYYRVAWTDEHQKRKSKRFKIKADADKFKSELYI